MSAGISTNIDELRSKLASRATQARAAIVKGLYECALIVRAAAVPKAPVDTGQLRASIQINVDEAKLTATVGTPLMHGVYMETGTRPGFGPNAGGSRGMPPLGEEAPGGTPALLGWVMRTFGVAQKEGARIAYVVGRKIQKEGTKPQPFLQPAFEESKGAIRDVFQQNMESVVR